MKTKVLAAVSLFLSTGIMVGWADSGEPRKRPESTVEERKIETEPSLFQDVETSADIFGTYAATGGGPQSRFKDGFGGGVGVNHFFLKYVGVGLDAYAWNGDRPKDGISGGPSGSLILRYPIENLHLAPYVFGGVGGLFTESRSPQLTEHGGIGFEYRFDPNWGVFADARYVFTDKDNDYALPRVGLRFIF